MKQNPLISVVIVCYNHSNFVVECLDSLLNQTYSNWELIIADDCSKDNSIQIIENWLNQNNVEAKKIFHKKNIGLCNTLNECIPLARGEYIKIIAADDFMAPNLFTRLLLRFEELPDEYKLVYSNARFIDEKGIKGHDIYSGKFDFDRNDIRNILFRGNMIIALTTMLKKEVYTNLGYYSSKFIIEDYEYWLRLSQYYKVDYIKDVLGYYRQHSDNISKKIDLDEEVIRIKIYHDKTGEFSRIINNDIINLYKDKRITKQLTSEYKNYVKKGKWLYIFLKLRIPYRWYHLKNIILNKIQ